MSRLFKREVALSLLKLTPGQFFADGTTNSVTIRSLRVAFDLEKTLKKQPNTATVRVWNLAPATRAAFETLPVQVRLEAGYDGTPRRLFEGDVVFASSKREGVDWITEAQLGDGDRAFRFARVNRSFRGGVSARAAVEELAKSMGLKPPRSSALSALAAQYVSGLSLRGRSSVELTRILAPHGIGWSIQDGRLQFLRLDDVRPDQAVVINQSTGLIGSPSYGTPEKRGRKPTLHLRVLLYPDLTPGGKIAVESQTATGTFKVTRLVHSGDTHSTNWYTTIEAVQA